MNRVDYSKILYPCTSEFVFLFYTIFIFYNSYTLYINLPLDLDNLYGLINYSDEINFHQTKKYKTNFKNLYV